MGNRSSTASSADGDGGAASGMFLTQELQAKINRDFDSRVLQSEWDEYRTQHLQRRNEREASSALREAEVKQQMEALQTQARQVHSRLDELVDAAKGRLVDLEVEVAHDVNRLSEKFEGSLDERAPEGKCLGVRADLSQCYNTLRDSGECQIFAKKLEKCVTEALKASS